MRKISFLIPAHNEGKIINQALNNLRKIKGFYKNIEVLVGLDGCTDNTLEIVKKYKFVKYFELNERKGKPVVIDNLIKEAKGNIIIIHDADWIFKVNKKSDLIKMISWFDDPKLGGIAESYPIEYDVKKLKKINSIPYLGSAWTNYFWMEFQKKRFTIRKDNALYINPKSKNFPFLMNIFRKKVYKKNITLGDDFERPIDVMKRGYLVRVLEDPNLPRVHTIFKEMHFRDILKQKLRTSIARNQVFSKYKLNIGFFNFYLPLYFYILFNAYKVKRIKALIGLKTYLLIIIYSMVKNKLTKRKIGTKEGWLMRAERK